MLEMSTTTTVKHSGGAPVLESGGLDLPVSLAREEVCRAGGVMLPLDEPEVQWWCLLASSSVSSPCSLQPGRVHCSPKSLQLLDSPGSCPSDPPVAVPAITSAGFLLP